MNKNAHPLDYLIQSCEEAIANGHWKLTKFNITNAKDELKRLRQKVADSYQELFNCNQDLTEEINKTLDYKIVGWAKMNDRGDLYDPRFSYNPYISEDHLIPLYSSEKEFKEKYGKLSK